MTATPQRQRRVSGNPLVLILVFLLLSAILTPSITLGMWPGEAKLTAPLLCPADQQDAFVVEDTTQRGATTLRNYSMYCVGPTGDFTEIGFLMPTLVLTGAHALILMVLTFAFVAVAIPVLKVQGRRRGPPTGHTPSEPSLNRG